MTSAGDTALPTRPLWLFAADTLAWIHGLISAFIVFGGIVVGFGWVPIWVQIPFAAWGVLTFMGNITCPLTPAEKWLRVRGGGVAYQEGFVERYIMPKKLRGKVKRHGNYWVALGILGTNVLIYAAFALARR